MNYPPAYPVLRPRARVPLGPLWVLPIVLTLLAGCTARVGLNGEMATPYHIQYDNVVERKPPAVYVRPTTSPDAAPTALFVPLRVTQSMARPQSFSRNVSRQIWQIWLSQQAFATLEYDDTAIPMRVSDALPLARKRGAQLLVGGTIHHFMDGGTAGDSTLSLNMEIYDVASGTMLWSISQGGSIEKKQATDFFLVGVQTRMPTDPMGLLIRTLAHDMGGEVFHWVYPGAKKSGSSWKKAF